jgi:hypothetical protein
LRILGRISISNRMSFHSNTYCTGGINYDGNHAACRLRTEAGRQQSLKTAEAGPRRSAINYLPLVWYRQYRLQGPVVCVLFLHSYLCQPAKRTLSLSEHKASLDACYISQRRYPFYLRYYKFEFLLSAETISLIN